MSFSNLPPPPSSSSSSKPSTQKSVLDDPSAALKTIAETRPLINDLLKTTSHTQDLITSLHTFNHTSIPSLKSSLLKNTSTFLTLLSKIKTNLTPFSPFITTYSQRHLKPGEKDDVNPRIGYAEEVERMLMGEFREIVERDRERKRTERTGQSEGEQGGQGKKKKRKR
ncbi:hypothetical protein TrLO_g9888 [Triparma laevis f. longispina]|uniref:Uncharacterized protein n=1 Tax=Triparma laevis f. longispina TaxID=1714387 RepID=A0A9W7FDX6_9STRA|nr:hypothetical protein TrLO_g9888 [Triparma laevis f. longispina]